MAQNLLDSTRYEAFLVIADFLVPAYPPMPAFSAVCSQEAVERSLGFRPDVYEEFARGLAVLSGTDDIEAMLERLNAEDKLAFNAICLIIAGTYYMQQGVRDAIGYPGQESVAYDAYSTPPYLLDGSLGQVIARGRKYKPTPGLE
jgi:hypothetical protein